MYLLLTCLSETLSLRVNPSILKESLRFVHTPSGSYLSLLRGGGVGTNLSDSLGILGFTLSDNVSERQVRRRYIELARKYHPDKNEPAESGRNKNEATIYFQLISNTHQ